MAAPAANPQVACLARRRCPTPGKEPAWQSSEPTATPLILAEARLTRLEDGTFTDVWRTTINGEIVEER